MIVPPKNRSEEFTAPGSKCDRPVSLIDLYPTLAEACAIDTPPELDGQSLLPLLQDPNLETDRAVITTFGEGNSTLRTDRWRYIRYEDGSEELYDHSEDPNEWHNLAGLPKHATRVVDFRRMIK